MNFLLIVVSLIVGAFIGIIIQVIYNKNKKEKDELIKRIDESFKKIKFNDCDNNILLREWEKSIDTQMHFNDLIIRFRSIILSVFIAGLGFIYGISKQIPLVKKDTYILIGLALVFWICCFILDYFYYHKLLLGAVNHAKKFDEK